MSERKREIERESAPPRPHCNVHLCLGGEEVEVPFAEGGKARRGIVQVTKKENKRPRSAFGIRMHQYSYNLSRCLIR